jgi:peroxiredoxin
MQHRTLRVEFGFPEAQLPMLEEGSAAPDFTGTTDTGTTLMLKELRGRKVVLYFCPVEAS